ncbi:acyl-CoA dehydrogenase family protein [Micromonospora profundi]|uniref:Acyl-CoA dehydrogenase family protein n=1 Tax=Micromonospora profundi TaxID=1420889 RepID=A0AAJ6KZ50_9ACTN|nr:MULTISPECIES: acyl-CoA dehydrogenase family protein [Micromonospora]NJC14874.1 alkylation response protein AidB-like acyl-CoA dehydrogenase [Micromonospora profundi]WLS46394.1 acyl-CoA dehydrogenase family protein [Micromonospora profundi]
MTITLMPEATPGVRQEPATPRPAVDFNRIAARCVSPRAAYAYDAEILDRVSWRDMADHGLWRIGVPPSLGGDGGSWLDLAEALADIARGGRDLGFTLSLIAHAGFVRALVEHGTAWHHRTVLPSLLNGAVGATALTETQGGSDVARIRTQAQADGDGWVLSGSKDHITNAPVADRALILARVPELGRRDITLFVLNLHSPGVRRGDPERLLGLRTSPTGALHLDDVRLPAEAVLGRPGDGLSTLYDIISFDRALYGLVAAAYLEPRLDEVVRYTRERQAFGSPIIDHQYVQGRLTDIRIAIEVSRALALAGIEALVRRDPQASLRCSVAKLLGSEGLVESAQNLMRLRGHLGYMRGDTTRDLQDALGTLIAGGTSEMQRKNILNQMLSNRGR